MVVSDVLRTGELQVWFVSEHLVEAPLVAVSYTHLDRTALENLRSERSRTDNTFKRVRKISEAFEHALDNIFFENKLIAPLTREYGVF